MRFPIPDPKKWNKWFAWYPVRVDMEWVWWEYVEYQVTYSYGLVVYRYPVSQESQEVKPTPRIDQSPVNWWNVNNGETPYGSMFNQPELPTQFDRRMIRRRQDPKG
jgi:hypothetical protein